MKQFTPKRASIENQYRKIKAQIMEEREHCCAGCGNYGAMITFSHRIPRSRRLDLMTDPNNIDLMCMSCHDKVETSRYDELLNGNEIQDYIHANDPELYYLKESKQI